MEQPTLADLEFTRKQHKTRRGKLLKRLEALVPWERLEARIEPHYPKAGIGRRPCALSVMLRVRLVQLCYNPVRDTHIQ
jgi:IS5 family transposase